MLRITNKSEFDVNYMIARAVSLFPDKASVFFISKCSDATKAKLKIGDLFKFYDKTTDSELEDCLVNLIDGLIVFDEDVLNLLKNIILSSESEQEEEAKGLSALADRDSAQQTTDFHSQKSKILALNFFIKTIKKIPNLGDKKIEEYLNFSIHLCSFNEELSIKGLKLAKTIFKVTFI